MRIHAASATDPDVAAAFATDRIFYDIRLEPYLVASARAHPDRADALHALVETTARNRRALVHGDVSPKNVLIGPRGPVFLDVGMRLVRRSGVRPRVLPESPAAGMSVDAARGARASRVLRRAGQVLPRRHRLGAAGRARRLCRSPAPGLFLAWIDGKSPVEYLTAADKERVRRVARSFRRAGRVLEDVRTPGRGSSGFDGRDPHRPGARAAVWDLPRPADCRGGGGARRRCLRPRDRPAGASTGSAEARDKRDGGASFGGYDARRGRCGRRRHRPGAARCRCGRPGRSDRRLIELDGTPDKGRLGANATIAVSMAVAHAAAAAAGEPLWRYLRPERAALPLPEIQIFGGGAHAGRRVDIQDFMVVCPGAATLPRRWTGPPRSTEWPAR